MAKNMILLLGLVLFTCLPIYAFHGSFTPDECCFHFLDQALPKKKVVSYRWTATHCSSRGIIMRMMSEKEFCVHPDHAWVKNVTKYVDSRSN